MSFESFFLSALSRVDSECFSVRVCIWEPTYRWKVGGEDLGGYVPPLDVFLYTGNLYKPGSFIRVVEGISMRVKYLNKR